MDEAFATAVPLAWNAFPLNIWSFHSILPSVTSSESCNFLISTLTFVYLFIFNVFFLSVWQGEGEGKRDRQAERPRQRDRERMRMHTELRRQRLRVSSRLRPIGAGPFLSVQCTVR